MERANIIQGDYSFWKAEYRWGGEPYPGVTAQANLTDPNIPPGIAYFNYDGPTMTANASLWELKPNYSLSTLEHPAVTVFSTGAATGCGHVRACTRFRTPTSHTANEGIHA